MSLAGLDEATPPLRSLIHQVGKLENRNLVLMEHTKPSVLVLASMAHHFKIKANWTNSVLELRNLQCCYKIDLETSGNFLRWLGGGANSWNQNTDHVPFPPCRWSPKHPWPHHQQLMLRCHESTEGAMTQPSQGLEGHGAEGGAGLGHYLNQTCRVALQQCR